MAEILLVSIGVVPAVITGITTWSGLRYKHKKDKMYIKITDLKNHPIMKIKDFSFYVSNKTNDEEKIIMNMFKKRYKIIKNNINVIMELEIKSMGNIELKDLIYNLMFGKDIFENINETKLYSDINFKIIKLLEKYEIEEFEENSQVWEDIIHSAFFCKNQKICVFLNIYNQILLSMINNFDYIIKNESILPKYNTTSINKINDIYKNIIEDFDQDLNDFLLKIDGEGKISFLYEENVNLLEYKRENIIGKNIITMLHPGEIDDYLNFLINDNMKNINHQLVLKNKSLDIQSIKYTSNFILIFKIKKSIN